MYVYIESENAPFGKLYTVGFYKPNGEWEPESDHGYRSYAAERVAWLNGSGKDDHSQTGYSVRNSNLPILSDVKENENAH